MSNLNSFKKELKEEAQSQTAETIGNFIKEKMELLKTVNLEDGYNLAPIIIGACATAAAYAADKEAMGGITGFQAGFVMWEFIRMWIKSNNECGLRLIDYDDMLYPQYDYKYEKNISKEIWEKIQEKAKNKIEDVKNSEYHIHPAVMQHWQNIADGIIPFGYKLSEEF